MPVGGEAGQTPRGPTQDPPSLFDTSLVYVLALRDSAVEKLRESNRIPEVIVTQLGQAKLLASQGFKRGSTGLKHPNVFNAAVWASVIAMACAIGSLVVPWYGGLRFTVSMPHENEFGKADLAFANTLASAENAKGMWTTIKQIAPKSHHDFLTCLVDTWGALEESGVAFVGSVFLFFSFDQESQGQRFPRWRRRRVRVQRHEDARVPSQVLEAKS